MKWNFLLSCKRRVVFVLLLPVITVQLASSQTSTTGAIRGTVTDPPGAAAQIVEKVPETGVVVLTMHDSEQVIREVFQAGARGLVLKSDADRDLIEAVEAVAKKRHFFTTRLSELMLGGYLAGTATAKVKMKSKAAQLTEREYDVVRLLADGLSNKEMAARLQISIRTVESHRININRKLRFNSIAKLVHYAIQHGIVAHTTPTSIYCTD